jgi:hypothetical protein
MRAVKQVSLSEATRAFEQVSLREVIQALELALLSAQLCREKEHLQVWIHYSYDL